VFYHLSRGRLHLPRQGLAGKVPLCPLGDMAELGFDRRDMHDGFRLAGGRTSYPALWCHDASQVRSMAQQPNQWLQPLSEAKPGRPLREATHLWRKAGRILIAERLRLNRWS
jgi:transposase